MNRGTAVVGFILSFIAGLGLLWGVGIDHRGSGARDGSHGIDAVAFADGEWSDEDAAVPVSSKDPVWGARTAPVTLVLFSDYECPFCSKVEATLDELKEKYGPNRLRIVWKNSPLPGHKNARPAAIAGEAVFRLGGNRAFWKWHEIAFNNQKALTPESFEAWAVQVGVDKAKFRAAIATHEVAAKIDADLESGRAAGVSGTPASFINGVLMSGALPFAKFAAVIDEQLKAAQAAIATGTPPDQVYTKLAEGNKAKNPATKRADDDASDRTVWRVPLGDSPVRGPATARVTVVVFADFQCPFCGTITPSLDEIQKIYGQDLRIIWKDQPQPKHDRAEPAAEFAREARAQKGDPGFWAAHDLMFASQQNLRDEDLLGYAKRLDLDVDKVKTAIFAKKHGAAIAADQELAAEFGAMATPHLFVNGRRLAGVQPIDKLRVVIDEELKKAERFMAKGVAAKDLYDELTKDGKTPPPPERKVVDLPGPDNPWKGGEKSKVVIQVFSDFQCPFCKQAGPTLDQVHKAYGDKIKIVWRHRPLPRHDDAPLASAAAQEIFKQKGNAGFWVFHDTLFAKLGSGSEALRRSSLEAYAREQGGIDLAKLKKALDGRVHEAFVDADAAVAERAGITSTPALVVHASGNKEGYFLSGAVAFTKIKKLVDRALKEAGEAAKAPTQQTGR